MCFSYTHYLFPLLFSLIIYFKCGYFPIIFAIYLLHISIHPSIIQVYHQHWSEGVTSVVISVCISHLYLTNPQCISLIIWILLSTGIRSIWHCLLYKCQCVTLSARQVLHINGFTASQVLICTSSQGMLVEKLDVSGNFQHKCFCDLYSYKNIVEVKLLLYSAVRNGTCFRVLVSSFHLWRREPWFVWILRLVYLPECLPRLSGETILPAGRRLSHVRQLLWICMRGIAEMLLLL